MSSVFLVGFMGCGKSSVARHLGVAMGCPWVDLDAEIEKAVGRSIPEIFKELGEESFRAAESDQLHKWLRANDVVVATGGGLFAHAPNRRRIRCAGARSVFLEVPWLVLEDRIEAADINHRPMYSNAENGKKLYAQRLPSYRRADLVFGLTGSETPAEVADLVHREIAGVACAT